MAWQVLSAVSLLAMGGIHLYLALNGTGGVLGVLFVLNAVGALVLAIAIAVLFVVQLVIGPINSSIADVFKDLGPGAYTTLVGGILVLVG
jgi:hypothetical protein